jgi:hypothetical protein
MIREARGISFPKNLSCLPSDPSVLIGGAMKGKACSSFLALVALGFNIACPNQPPNYPIGTIELKYYAPGIWPVTASPGGACCDSAGNKFDLYYPTNLGAGGFMHPILTWGNGTLAQPHLYDYFLRHLASWGFVVIATEDQFTGVGQTILDGANFMVHANSDPTSIFFHKLNVSQIGSFGHSQGASGAANALIKSAGSIKTVLPIELPAQVWCTLGSNCFDGVKLASGSVFFIDGSADLPISPPTQTPQTPGEQSIEAFYNAVPSSVLKVKGTLIGPSHNDVQGQPDCKKAMFPCVNGVYGYLGYPTAWFMYQLQGDAVAHGAFVNGTGEIFSQSKNWAFVASNIP